MSHEELRIGVQAYRSGEHVLRRLFIADSLENGAGYAPHLGKDEVFREVMARLANEIEPRLVSESHASVCDTSCPDCLRSYTNRQLHPYLDWRLALDVAALAAEQALPLDRWLDQAEPRVRAFASAFGMEVMPAGSLWAAYDAIEGRAAFFGHPLWRPDEAWWVEEQEIAALEIAEALGPIAIRALDMMTLIRYPSVASAWLTARHG